MIPVKGTASPASSRPGGGAVRLHERGWPAQELAAGSDRLPGFRGLGEPCLDWHQQFGKREGPHARGRGPPWRTGGCHAGLASPHLLPLALTPGVTQAEAVMSPRSSHGLAAELCL